MSRSLARAPSISFVVLVLSLFVVGCERSGDEGGPTHPETLRSPVTDVIHGVSIVDDYRWLEDEKSEEVQGWIESQNAHSDEVLAEVSGIRAEFRRLLTGLMVVASVGTPIAAGESEVFSLRRKGEAVARIVRRPKEAEGSASEPIEPTLEYDVLVDPLTWRSDGTSSVSPLAASPDGSKLLYSVRDGGPDETQVRIFDLEAKRDLADVLPAALYGSTFVFDKESTAFLYVHRSRQEGPRVKLHQIGTDPQQDAVLFGEGLPPTQFLQVGRSGDDRWLLYGTQAGWRRTELFRQPVGDDGVTPAGDVQTLVAGVDARFGPQYGIEYHGGQVLVLTNHGAPRNRVVAIDPDEPQEAQWLEVLPEAADTLLSVGEVQGRLVARYSRDASVRLRVFSRGWRDEGPLDSDAAREIELADIGSASVRPGKAESALLTTISFMQPERTWTVDLESDPPAKDRTLWKDSEVTLDTDAFTVRRIWASSKDGTRLPVFVVHRNDVVPTSETPALLYGYGGFNAALLPGFRPSAAAWVEAGGLYASAVLRGGGEFGEDWHRDGMLEDKQTVFDDFIAAGEALISEGLTSHERLALSGTSNGGLLVAAVMTQRPDLARAVYCGFPDLDMIRFVRFEQTNNKPALLEYGDASDPQQFEFLRSYSPYQAVEDDQAYPAVLFATGALDTRVPPLQARKMAARMQAATSSGRPVLLRHDPRAGHAGGRPMGRVIDDTAAQLAFLWWQVEGPSLE